MFFKKTKKLAVSFLLTLFVFSSFTGFIISAQPAQAQLGVAVITDAYQQASDIWATIKNGLKIAVMNAAQQAVGYFLRKVAYDSAVWLAAGGKGQTPFAHTSGVGDYLKNVGDDAAGAAIDSFGKTFGLDLCKIPDVKIDLALRIGLHYNYGAEPPKPACNLSTFASTWGGAAMSVYRDGGVDPSKIFSASLKVDDSDLGISMKTSEKIDRLYLQQKDDAMANRLEGGGFKAVTGLIDNRIKTPAQVTADEMKANAPNKQNEKSQAQIGAAMGSGAYEIIPSTLSIFLNTLSNQMLKNFRENGMLPFGVGCIKVPGVTGSGNCPANGSVNNPNSAGAELTGRAVAEATFSEFLTPKLGVANDYDILAQLSSCDSHGLYNCRADQSLIQAIQETKHGNPVTIAQAIQKGWLHGSGKLIPPTNVAFNTNPHCFDGGNYCYSNIAVLRQLGVLPLGFEIAAKNSDPDQPVSLEEVVKRFYDCNYQKDGSGNIVGVISDPANYPYCHLIDPNWVLKLEQTRCDALGYGPSSVGSDVPDRLQECMDLKTCVGRDSNGDCMGYGYCVREKNVWRFDADKCDAQFATCRSFSNSQGQQFSYLYRTLDTGSCDQTNVGCSAYSLNQNAAGWVSPSAPSLTNYSNNGVYLNGKVSTCNASAAGCSAFKLVREDSGAGVPKINNINTDLVYLKKAPDYLNCYDKNANSSDGISWPETLSDIIKMSPKAECKDYAQVCVASEVGCSLFKNTDDVDAPAIPGKFLPATVVDNKVQSWNDQCDARCVGYSAYQEMPTTYSNGNPVAYIVPPSKYNNNSSGLECEAQDDGCASFTNMEADSSGGEKVEYFTNLRNCIKPNTQPQNNFYTYEGSKLGGYQLQVYTLQKFTDGSPLTVFKDDDERNYANQYKCNESLYKKGLSDPDCRQFNDDGGKVYYALLPNTVVVSADCSQYRLNSGELASGGGCFGNGKLINGACYYYGLPSGAENSAGISQTCAAEVVSCRAYKGNHGNNIKTISLNASSTDPVETFETTISVTAQNGWTGSAGSVLNQSNESAHVGGHSLEFLSSSGGAVLSKQVPYLGEDVDLASAQSFDLTFWAKGTGLNVAVGMKDNVGAPVNAGTFSTNNTWQAFKFRIRLPSTDATTENTLTFSLQSAGSLFLDNVRLTKVSDFIYLVKDSLKVDSICDDEPNDNLPGAALGCTAYSGPKNSLNDTLYYLTNFSYLCRDGAIGCTAFKDTFNKVSDNGPRAYNIFLPVASGGVKAVAKIGSDSYSCQVEQGKNGCYVNVKGHTVSEIVSGKVNNSLAPVIGDSAYLVAPDSTDTSTIYLVADGSENSTCNQVDVGCTYAGKQTNTPSGVKYVTTTVKVDPNQFESGVDANGNPQSGTLCQKEALGCDEYSSSKGNIYFKDPALTGNKICSFNSYTDPTTNKTESGWFWKGVGLCGNSTTLAVASATAYCTADSDCSGGNTCLANTKDKQACYPDYKKNNNYFDLWSYGDTGKYKNFVGECPAEQDTCTELVDHADNDKAYYLLDNGRLTDGDCSGQVSQKAGCVLFDQTDKPNKIYNVTSTYAKSDGVEYNKNVEISNVTKVQPVTIGDTGANRIISVKRDRECAEWLQCKASTEVWNEQLNKPVIQCKALGLCDRLPAGSNKGGQNVNCAEFITGQSDYSNKVLSEDKYVTRDVSWKGKDLVGFSMLGKYPVEELWQFNVATNYGSEPNWRLLKLIPCGSGANCAVNKLNVFACSTVTSTAACGVQSEGKCVNGLCAQNVEGKAENLAAESTGQSCRAYPEKDSPFPNLTSNNTYNFNKCFEKGGDPLNPNDPQAYLCECDYLKATFGNKTATKYFSQKNESLLSTFSGGNKGVCVGGSENDSPCQLNSANPVAEKCEQGGGACQVKDKKDKNYYGWKGFCLEYDKSRNLNGSKDNPVYPCLSWLPVDLVGGAIDLNNTHPESSVQLPADTKYCLASDLYRSGLKTIDACYYPNTNVYTTDGDCQKFANSVPVGYKFVSAMSGGTTGSGDDCTDHWPDYCRVIYEPNGTYKDGTWYSKVVSNFQERQIGCQAFLQLGGTQTGLSPWADRLWKDSKTVFNKQLDVSNLDVGYKDKLNYTLNTTSSPYASLADGPVNSNLYLLRYCLAGSAFEQPLSSYLCKTGSLGTYKGVPSNNFAYDQWKLAAYSNCSDDAACNYNTNCYNETSTSTCIFNCMAKDPNGNIKKDKDGKPIPDDYMCSSHFNGSKCDVATFLCTNTTSTPIGSMPNCNGNYNSCESAGFLCNGNCRINGNVSSTLSCTKDVDCYQSNCVGDSVKECVAKGQNAPSNDKPLLDKIKESVNLLLQIYAKIPKSSIRVFSTSKQDYGLPNTAGYENLSIKDSDLDITGNIFTNYNTDTHLTSAEVPRVHPVGPCNTKGECIELASEGFNVNGKNPISADDNVIIDSKPFEASFSFFYEVESNHMPARRIIVDPDTLIPSDIQSTGEGSFWNQRGYVENVPCLAGVCSGTSVACKADIDCKGKMLPICTSDETKAPAFGYIINKTCEQRPYGVKFYYDCRGEDDPRWDKTCSVLKGAQLKKWQDLFGNGGNAGCCVYQPKVQVLDNWGWCNGVCKTSLTNGSDGTDGCYDGNPLASGKLECSYYKMQIDNDPSSHSNTLFKARVVVPPNKIEKP